MEVYHQKWWSNQDPFNFKYQMTFFFEDFTVMCCKFLSQKNQNNSVKERTIFLETACQGF